jgi:hypothetical protein
MMVASNTLPSGGCAEKAQWMFRLEPTHQRLAAGFLQHTRDYVNAFTRFAAGRAAGRSNARRGGKREIASAAGCNARRWAEFAKQDFFQTGFLSRFALIAFFFGGHHFVGGCHE